MKKFANDLLEVGKDIVQGLSFCAEVYCNFWQHTVWFAWDMKSKCFGKLLFLSV